MNRLWMLLSIALVMLALASLQSSPAFAQTTAAPEITSLGPFAIKEGATAIGALTATDSDTAASDLMWSKMGGADSAAFTLTGDGVLSFEAAKDYETLDDANGDGSYELTVQVSDGDNTDSAQLLVTVENVTELLTTITGLATVTFAENAGTRVATFKASSDADRDGIEWVIGGTDVNHFSIDTPPGALRFDIAPVSPNLFASPPDFEDADDEDTNNVYSITLQAQVGTETTSPLAVMVTVTDVDEPGALALSSQQPKLGVALTATLSDPDGITEGTTTWEWERNDGREGWLEIAGATSASYTPTAADGDRYLRVKATYTDGFGSSKTAERMAPHVVIAHRLSALTVSGLTGVTRDDRVIYPDFDPDTLHYAARCTESITLTLTAEESGSRLSVNGIRRPKGEAFTVAGLGHESDIRITLTGSTGASTTYTVHCIDREQFPKLTTVKADGATDDLMMFRAKWMPPGQSWRGALVMMDNNGVPRLRKMIDDSLAEYFRVYPDKTHPRARYAFQKQGSSYSTDGVEMVVLDKYFNVVDDDVHILPPFNNTDKHDQFILPNGDYVLMAYSRHRGDLSFLNTAFPEVQREPGTPLGRNEAVWHSAIQVRTADGMVKLNWSSWDHMAIEDCIRGSTIQNDYAHINSLGLIDGDIIAGFRNCSKILRIDMDTGDVVWRLGPSLYSREQWEAGKTLQPNRGPAPLDFVNDPRGGFSGQHGGHMTVEGNLLVYDNATHCDTPPGVPDDAKGLTECDVRTRAAEYAIDTSNGELVFLREFLMPETDPPKTVGGFAGHAEPMDNGDWMISWSNTIRSDPRAPMPNTAMQVDAQTGTEKLGMTLQNVIGNRGVNEPHHTRVVMVSPVALAPPVEELSSSFPASASTSVFHTGAADTPQVVVAFNRPVVDFAASSPSLRVTGGTVASVSAHLVNGEPANAYLVTLTPDGDGAITFQLLTGRTCAEGGICTADGTTLTDWPAALVIVPVQECAGPDLNGVPGKRVTLQGACGAGPNGEPKAAHTWTQLSGPPVTLDDATRGDPSFTIPEDAAVGTTLEFQLTVNDREGRSYADTMIVTVAYLPTACAGPDLTGAPGEEVTLHGRCSTNPYGPWHRLAHAWTQLSGPTVTLSDTNRGDPSFTLPANAADGTTLEFQLEVTDREGQTDTDTVVVTVDSTPDTTLPTACAGPDLEAQPGDAVTLEGTCSTNPHGTWWRMAHRWTQPEGQNIVLSDATLARPTFTVPADAAPGTVYTFTLTVTDQDEESDSDDMMVTVAPPLTACAGPDLTGTPGETVTLQGRCSTNPFGPWHNLVHAWTQLSGTTVNLSDPSRGDPSFTVPANAADGTTLEFQLTVTDKEGQSDTDTVVVTVDSSPPSTPPTACAGPDIQAQPGEEVTLQGDCSVNPHGQWWRMAHRWTQPEEQNIVLSDATLARPTFTVPADAAPGTVYAFTLTVTDKDGESDSDDMMVAVPGVTVENRAPSFNDGVNATREVAENIGAGVNVGSAITATDPDVGDTLTYSLSGTDTASFGINTETGQLLTIEGVTYDYETQVSYSVTVEATDPDGASASIAVTVSLVNVNEAPVFNDGDSAIREVAENSAAGVNVGAAITATDPDVGDTLTYSLSGTDATSFSIDASGQLTTLEGVSYDYETQPSYTLVVEASDGNGGTASIAVTVNLTDEAEATPVTACFTDLGTLSAAAEYAGAWDDPDCKAHHQDSPGRYFHFTLDADTEVSISLSAGTLYVSQGTPQNGWGTEPNGTYEDRRRIRRDNGKLVHDGAHTGSNSVTLTLAAGDYTAEAAGDSGGGPFILSIDPR